MGESRVLSRFLVRRPRRNYRRLKLMPKGRGEARRAKLLGGSGGMPPWKILKIYVCRDTFCQHFGAPTFVYK